MLTAQSSGRAPSEAPAADPDIEQRLEHIGSFLNLGYLKLGSLKIGAYYLGYYIGVPYSQKIPYFRTLARPRPQVLLLGRDDGFDGAVATHFVLKGLMALESRGLKPMYYESLYDV